MKKRVLHVLSSDVYSGAENVAAYIINSLNDTYDIGYTSPDGPIRESLQERGINYISIKKFSRLEIKRKIDEFKPDIIHAHDFTATVKCIMLNLDIPIVSHIHQNPSWLKSINAYSIILNIMSRKINHMICVSPAILESMKSYKKLKHKISLVENIVDINSIEHKSKAFFTQKYDLVFIGRLVDVKNPIRFIKIISRLAQINPNIKACMIGDGELKDDCTNIIRELKLNENIELKGYMKNPFPVLNNSKLFVMTSKSEGLPMTVIEALSLGKPVISTKIDGIEKVIDDKCGVICSSDEEYIEAIISILNDEDEYIRKSNSSKNKANNMCNKLLYKQKIIQIYEGVE